MSIRFFTTPGESTEKVLYHTASNSRLVFSVKTCSDAVVYLYDHIHDVNTIYSVVIGADNNNLTLIIGGNLQASVSI